MRYSSSDLKNLLLIKLAAPGILQPISPEEEVDIWRRITGTQTDEQWNAYVSQMKNKWGPGWQKQVMYEQKMNDLFGPGWRDMMHGAPDRNVGGWDLKANPGWEQQVAEATAKGDTGMAEHLRNTAKNYQSDMEKIFGPNWRSEIPEVSQSKSWMHHSGGGTPETAFKFPTSVEEAKAMAEAARKGPPAIHPETAAPAASEAIPEAAAKADVPGIIPKDRAEYLKRVTQESAEQQTKRNAAKQLAKETAEKAMPMWQKGLLGGLGGLALGTGAYLALRDNPDEGTDKAASLVKEARARLKGVNAMLIRYAKKGKSPIPNRPKPKAPEGAPAAPDKEGMPGWQKGLLAAGAAVGVGGGAYALYRHKRRQLEADRL